MIKREKIEDGKIIGLWGNCDDENANRKMAGDIFRFVDSVFDCNFKDIENNGEILFLFHCRIFSVRRCARCGAGIGSSDLVMRARDLVFHVNCFSCALCGLPLAAGDTAGIRGGRIFCCEHYETELQL